MKAYFKASTVYKPEGSVLAMLLKCTRWKTKDLEMGSNFFSMPIKLALSDAVYQNMEMLFYKTNILAIVSATHNSYPKEPYVQKDQLS